MENVIAKHQVKQFRVVGVPQSPLFSRFRWPRPVPGCVVMLEESFRVALKSLGWILLYGGSQGSLSTHLHFLTPVQYGLVAAGLFVLLAQHEKVVIGILRTLTFVFAFMMFVCSSNYAKIEAQSDPEEPETTLFWIRQVFYGTVQVSLVILTANTLERKLKVLAFVFCGPFLLPQTLLLSGFSSSYVIYAHTLATSVWKVGLSLCLILRLGQGMLAMLELFWLFRDGYRLSHLHSLGHFKLFWVLFFVYGVVAELWQRWMSGKTFQAYDVVVVVFCQSFNSCLPSAGAAMIIFWIYTQAFHLVSRFLFKGTNVRARQRDSFSIDDGCFLLLAWHFCIPEFGSARQINIISCFLYLVLVTFLQEVTEVVVQIMIDVSTNSNNFFIHIKTLGSCLFLMSCSIGLFSTLVAHDRVEFTFLWFSALAVYSLVPCTLLSGYLVAYFTFYGDPTSENLDDTVFVGRVVLQMLLFFGDLLGSAASIMNVLGSDSNLSTYLMVPSVFIIIFKRVEKVYVYCSKRLSTSNRMRNLHSANVQEILAYNDVCAICFSSLEKDARFTRCTHLFHTSCLRKWMEYQDTCPVCKTVVHSDEEDLDQLGGFSDEEVIVLPNSPQTTEEEGL